MAWPRCHLPAMASERCPSSESRLSQANILHEEPVRPAPMAPDATGFHAIRENLSALALCADFRRSRHDMLAHPGQQDDPPVPDRALGLEHHVREPVERPPLDRKS